MNRGKTKLPACYSTVQPGLEPVAAEEIASDLGGEVKKSGREMVVFRIPEIDPSILDLRTTEDVFLLVWGTDQLSHKAADLDHIRRWTAQADWDHFLRIHHAIRPKPKGKPTYRLVTQKTGEHAYRRIDAGDALAKGLAGKLPASWKHAEENAAVEIWLTIHGTTAVCGLRLSDRTMRHRTYKVEHLAASLRPTVAAAMVRLAETRPGQVLLDPMCGAGSILAEHLASRGRQLASRGREPPEDRIGKLAGADPPGPHGPGSPAVLGGDIDLNALRAARGNLRGQGAVQLVRWDATHLPLTDASVDRIVSNLPFGKQIGVPEEIGPLYLALLPELDRVLRPGGRAVLLVSDMRLLRQAARGVAWKLTRDLAVRVLGQPAVLSVWRKC